MKVLMSEEILAKVLIDKESPFLKSIVLNKGSKDKIKIGMASRWIAHTWLVKLLR